MARVAVEEEACEGYVSARESTSTSMMRLMKEDRVYLTVNLYYADGFIRYKLRGPPHDIESIDTLVQRPLRMDEPSCRLFEQVDAAADFTVPTWAKNLEHEVAYGDTVEPKRGNSMNYAPGGPVWTVGFRRVEEDDVGLDDLLYLMEKESGVDVRSYYEQALEAEE